MQMNARFKFPSSTVVYPSKVAKLCRAFSLISSHDRFQVFHGEQWYGIVADKTLRTTFPFLSIEACRGVVCVRDRLFGPPGGVTC